MKYPFNKKQTLVMVAIVLIGALLAALIVVRKPAQPQHGDHEEHGEHADTAQVDHGGKPHQEDAVPARGPHGGKLFVSQGYGLEVTILDHSAGPQFRIFTYQDGKPLDPAATKATLSLERLGRVPQTIGFYTRRRLSARRYNRRRAAFLQGRHRRPSPAASPIASPTSRSRRG